MASNSRPKRADTAARVDTAITKTPAHSRRLPSIVPSLGVVVSASGGSDRHDDRVPNPPLTAPLLFAHRGGRAHAPENTLEAFVLALRLGATGLESDVWCTADGVPVLHHDGQIGRRFRRRTISTLALQDLPPEVPTLADLYARVGSRIPLSLDVKESEAVSDILRVASVHGALPHLWLCHPDPELLARWRDLDSQVVLVHSTRLERVSGGLERWAANLSDAGIDAVNLPEPDWSGGLVSLFRRFGLRCLGWDAQHPRQIDRLLRMHLDGIFGDHVDRLVDGAARLHGGL